MDFTTLRIVFMGTPDFAVASLQKLHESGCHIVGVVTAPDKPAGRGMNLQETAVKKYAMQHGLTLLQPEKLKNPSFIDELKSLQADLQVVVAFRMLPEIVWNMPPMGTLNLHGSLLPQYRGAAPINWAIINGEKYTGVTTFKLKHEIDTGDILLAEKIIIEEDETAGSLHDKMKLVGATLLLKTIQQMATNDMMEIAQDNYMNETIVLKHAPKIYTETCRIDWNRNIDEVYNQVRGLSPYPAAFTELNNKKLKIFSVDREQTTPTIEPGAYETDFRNYLKFACTNGYLQINDLQLEGKKRMKIRDFLSGFRFRD